MPQALVALIVGAIGLTGTIATIATAVITLAISVGLNAIANKIFGKGGTPKPSDGQRVVRVSVGSRIRHYGKVRVAGQITFYDSKGGTLYVLLTTGQGKISAITEYQLNGKAVTVDGSGRVTSLSYSKRGTNYPVHIYSRDGSDSQSAYSQLTAAFSEWTTNHRQRGCSSILMTCDTVPSEFFSDVYAGNQEPEPSLIMETSLIYDPRKDSTQVVGRDGGGGLIYGSGAHRRASPSTWEYSDNWALCFADYLAHADGYGLGMEMINWENVAGEADLSDELLTTVDARTVKRWRVAGSYRLADDERRAVVDEFLKAGDGFMWQDANGLANIRCGRWIAPTVHIPSKHIIGCTASLGADPQDRANEVRVIYMEPRFNYTETEATPTVDDAARAALGRSEVQRFDCYFCPDHNQAKRIGKRILTKLQDRWTLTITTNLYGLSAIGERFITVTIEELAITAMSFEITSFKIDPAHLNVEIGLIEAHEADFAFDAATEEGTPPGLTEIVNAIVLDPPTGLTLATTEITVGITTGVAILATWDDPGRMDLRFDAQFKATADTAWGSMTVTQDEFSALTGIINPAVEYQVRVRSFTILGRASAWSAIETITPTATASAPPAPTDLSAIGNAGYCDLAWRNPYAANFGFVRVYRGTTSSFAGATAIGDFYGGLLEVMYLTDDNGGSSLSPGTYYWWFRSYDSTGALASSPAGPIDAVVT